MKTLALVAVGVAVAVSGCSASTDDLTGNNCIVNVSGNKLCGEDAKAWCDTTDELRSGGMDDPTVRKSQSVCDSIRGK